MKFEVKVTPGAKINQIQEGIDGNIKIWVTAKAEDGKANKKVREMLSKHFKVAKNCVEIIRGHKDRRKIINIIK